jgi:hypothetical protein
MGAWLLHLFVLTLSIWIVWGDEKFYRDTNAMDISDAELLSSIQPTVECSVTTSNSYLAETADVILATFKGGFAVSGPHSIGTFSTPGSTTTVSVKLSWVIGELEQVILQKKGSDQWLLAHMQCRLGNLLYELNGPKQWLDVGGVEPLLSELLSEVPAADVLTLQVVGKVLIYTSQGLTSER